ncbi:MAG: BamA/TamA family outer membrane protein [Dysgonamonadaceae bacterium]|jgi:outer membrane protein assembly factor BamA|nr:BamA/TamA family outer membrane protein [Dysgonamonadaceae bacterium]
MKFLIRYLFAAIILLAIACSTTKNIPFDRYLLDRINIQTDSGVIDRENLIELIRQKPNDPKFGLKVYNLAGNDSSWFGKMLRKAGEPPVIFDERLMNQSFVELSIEAKNRGYLNATVDAVIDTVGRKVCVEYHVHEGVPYRIRGYEIALGDDIMNNVAKGVRNVAINRDSLSIKRRNDRKNKRKRQFFNLDREISLREGSIFDMRLLENEMNRVANRLRNGGYYKLSPDNLHYLADTALCSNQVDLKMILKDTASAQLYRIGRVNVFSGYDRSGGRYRAHDSLIYNNINIYYDRLKFLRPSVIAGKIIQRPGGLYRQRAADATYSLFQTLDCVNNVRVDYVDNKYIDSTLLDCNIYLSPADNHSVQASINGTNKAGDFGVAVDVNYSNHNLFNGSEKLDIKFKGSYEFVNNQSNNYSDRNFFEAGVTPTLTFSEIHLPVNRWLKERFITQTMYGVGFNVQRRPEFQRNFFNLHWQFRWSGRNNILTQTFSPVEINYVYMPWKSDAFDLFLANHHGPVTRYSYENMFTFGSSYGLIYTNNGNGKYGRKLYTIRLNVESSGNLLNLLFSLNDGNNSRHEKPYNILGNPYAQYLKGDIDIAGVLPFVNGNSLALHAGFGIAKPYGNSSVLPFEERFYAGGPNHVRGWNTRRLGPGSLRISDGEDTALQMGDINFILTVEYRYRALGWLEPALFIDCGNIWTIDDYLDQPGGKFNINSFYREIAVGAGLGLRFDFKFLIFRIDAGKRICDPSLPVSERFVVTRDPFFRNWKGYVAIGYPF